MSYNEYKSALNIFLKNNPSRQEIVLFIEQYKEDYPTFIVSILKATFSRLGRYTYCNCTRVVEPVLASITDVKFLQSVRDRYLVIDKNYDVKGLNKRIFTLKAFEDFLSDKNDFDITHAMKNLNKFCEKYYYLERTILKKIYSKIKIPIL